MPNQRILQTVSDDVTNGLKGSFGRRAESDEEPVVVHPELDDGNQDGGEDQPVPRLIAVPWIYRCVHDGDFQGLFRTGRELEIHGVTFVDGRTGTDVLARYVDWMGVVNQLGLDVSWRVPVDLDEYQRGKDMMRAARAASEEPDGS